MISRRGLFTMVAGAVVSPLAASPLAALVPATVSVRLGMYDASIFTQQERFAQLLTERFGPEVMKTVIDIERMNEK